MDSEFSRMLEPYIGVRVELKTFELVDHGDKRRLEHRYSGHLAGTSFGDDGNGIVILDENYKKTVSVYEEQCEDFGLFLEGYDVDQMFEIAMERVSALTSLSATAVRILQDVVGTLPPDLELISIENARIPAHKVMLSSRSPVFAAMFATEMKEKQTNEVMMKDYTSAVLETFIALIYFRPTPMLKEHFMDIIQLLDMFQMGSMEELVDIRLTDYIDRDTESADALYHHAKKHQQLTIADRAIQIRDLVEAGRSEATTGTEDQDDEDDE